MPHTHKFIYYSAGHDKTTFEQNLQLFTTRGSQKLLAIAAAAAVTHHTHTRTQARTGTTYIHTYKET